MRLPATFNLGDHVIRRAAGEMVRWARGTLPPQAATSPAGSVQRGPEPFPCIAVVVGGVYDAVVVEVVEFFGVRVQIQPDHLGLLHDTRLGSAPAAATPTRPCLGVTVRVQVVGRNCNGLYETRMVSSPLAAPDGDHVAPARPLASQSPWAAA